MTDKIEQTELTNEQVVESLFNADLNFGGLIIKDFSPKKEFELNGLWTKLYKKVKDENTSFDYESILDNVPFEVAERVAKWLEQNSNVNEILIETGDIMRKVQLFVEIVMDYYEYKKKLKK